MAASHDGRFDARQRPPHRAGTDVHARVVGDHDAARLRLPPVVVKRQAERLASPDDGFGIERLADAGQEPQIAKIVLPRPRPSPTFIIMRIAVGAVYHTRTCCFSRIPYHRSASKSAFVDDARDAVGQRGDDAVRSAGHPAGIGRAPENVVGMQVEGDLPRDVVGHDRVMDVHRPLRSPRRAAGEVQQRPGLPDRSAGSRTRRSTAAISARRSSRVPGHSSRHVVAAPAARAPGIGQRRANGGHFLR